MIMRAAVHLPGTGMPSGHVGIQGEYWRLSGRDKC